MADFTPEDILRERGRDAFRRLRNGIIPITLLIAALWLATGFYVVQPGEIGVVRRFGKEVRQTEPGLRYRLPFPVERADIVNMEVIRRTEIGFRTVGRRGGNYKQRVSEEALMLTGDENIVEAQVIVQYQIKNPSNYLFRVSNPDEVLLSTTEVALRSVVGNTSIDELLTVGREHVQFATREFLQRLLDNYETGLRINEVRLQVVDAPDQVKDAFHEVVRAREDRERLINQAQGYQEDIMPKARGKAQEMLREAEGYKEERILRAQGDANRFLALLAEYRKAEVVTRTRLHREAAERVLSRVKKVLVDPRATGSVSGLLPLSEFRLIEKQAP